MKALLAHLIKSTPVHVGFAFVAMGGWAYYANIAYPFPKPLIAGMVQGIISALLTLFLKGSVDWMRPKFPHLPGHFVPALIAAVGSATLLIVCHRLAGTPEIATTIAVPLTVSSLYILTYNTIRQRGAKGMTHD